MSFNGAGLFQINTAGQPVVDNTLIDTTVFNALTADLATGLSTCITKDGQTTPTANIPMGGFKVTGLGLGTSNTDAASVQNANSHICEGRLTLTSGTPVTTTDVNSAATLYWTPYKGNKVALYDGTNWNMRTFSELSLTVSALTASKMYDIFVYDNAGTATLEALVWTNDTTRATALTTQDGVLVKTGAVTRRYLGSLRTNGSSLAFDAADNRWLWNYYHRALKYMRRLEATDNWTYTTATLRQANGAVANQLEFVIGVAEDLVSAEVYAFYSNSTAGVGAFVAIGLDSTSALATGCLSISGANGGANYFSVATSAVKLYPGVGRHFLAWLEYSAATGTTTWYGDNSVPLLSQSGIHGQIWC